MTPSKLREAADLYDKFTKQVDNYKLLKTQLENHTDLIMVKLDLGGPGYEFISLPPDVILTARKNEIKKLFAQLQDLGIASYELPPMYEL